ncbi:MAG TPA: hypothetical protein VF070_20070 [Streptosporangiaceae bacterium]
MSRDAAGARDAGTAGARDVGAEGEPIIIANEFVDVEVRRVHTRNGVRLEIHSPRRGTTIRLDAMILDALTWQQPEIFSEMLRSE